MTAAECAKAVTEAFRGLGLLRSKPEALAGVPLPAASKEFLLTGGLPNEEVFGFNFDPVRNLPTVSDYAAERGYPPVEQDLATARCIGGSWGALMVLDAVTWNVLWIDLRGRHEAMFVNSNVESLGASLAAYASLGPLRGTLENAPLSVRFQQMLLRIDARCVDGWWSTVIQEIEFGVS